ncbi:LLM class flavin-dependent oxidoreductase [Streptomyces roseicoloratus]|uniref:LLM class flavin-dependent oxidoreductase n=1 Tax=Streptomyces roseicoloratus TaxID=2508722 RepID=UPI001009C006|nr:LLM class flavin-dependent oxidoreductase [Streptomyces roseicoloratus]
MPHALTGRLALGVLLHGSGGHWAGWRHPEAHAAGQLDYAFHETLARELERGRVDVLFRPDLLAAWGDGPGLHRSARADHFEPLGLLSGLAGATRHIGVVATGSTTYWRPAQLARRFATADLLSGGRAGWNVVTSVLPQEAANFGRAPVPHDVRYQLAAAVLDDVRHRWDLAHAGDRALLAPPQGHPVLFQAGSSEAGRAFAARYAEVVFTDQRDLASARRFYADVKERVRAAGRRPEHVQVWPAFWPLVTATDEEAPRQVAALRALVHADVARQWLEENLGLDLSRHDLDGPLPEIPPTDRSEGRRELLLRMGRERGMTVRRLAEHFLSRQIVAGTPATIADHLQEWYEERGADGFMVSFPYLPGPLVDFVDHVIPELRRRGLFPDAYEGHGLRENLGLPRHPLARGGRRV